MKWSAESAMIQRLTHEPWVKLETGAELENWDQEDEIAYNQANRQAEKLLFFINAFDFVKSLGIGGDYYEFGCHRARTFRMALTEARRHGLDGKRFFAFDSFEGLPEAQTETGVPSYHRGALSTSEDQFWQLVRDHGIYVENIRIIKGFYQDRLTTALQKQFVAEGAKIAIACIDCDLYESAAPVFHFIEPLIHEGTVLYIDDYFAGHKGSPLTGPARAFHEFERESGFKFIQHLQVGWWGRSFIAYK